MLDGEKPRVDSRDEGKHPRRNDLELSMGPFCVTRSNPTHQLTDQPNPTHYKWKNLDPTQPNTTAWCNQILSNRALNSLTYSFPIFSIFSGPNPTHQKLQNLGPTQLNPWANRTQPMDNSERSVIRREDNVDGRARVTADEERVLQGG